MKKYASLGIIILFAFAFTLTGCGYTYQVTKTEAVVLGCEKGEFHPNPYYLAISDTYRIQENYGIWTYYHNLAYAEGKYDYIVTVNVDGTTHSVIREREFETGECISITIVYTYKGDRLVNIECK